MEPDVDWSVSFAPHATVPECDLVRSWLREYNRTANPEFFKLIEQPEHHARPLVLLATAKVRVIGGLIGETQFSWLKISIMAVDPEYRSRGIGTALLAAAEQEAVARGCKYVYVDTMEYQAPRFYQTHGYEIAGQLADWDSHGHAKFFFTKRLE